MFKMSAYSVDTSWQMTPHSSMAWFTTDLFSSHHTVRCAHKLGDVINSNIVACSISSRLKWYKNYINRLRLAKVIVINKISRFLWFSVYELSFIVALPQRIIDFTTLWNIQMIGNLLRYICAKNCRNRWSFDKAIAKYNGAVFLPHMV